MTGRTLAWRRSIAAAVLLAAFGVVLGLVAGRWTPLLTADRTAIRGLNRDVHTDGALVEAARVISTVLHPDVLRVVAVLAAAAAAIRRHVRLVVVLVGAVVASVLLSSLIKVAVGRVRPVVPFPVAHASGGSFPSGHALTSLLLLGLFAWLVAPRLSGARAAALWSVVAVLVLLVGGSRLVLGVHYPSDIAGGWLLAGIALLGLTALGDVPRAWIGASIGR